LAAGVAESARPANHGKDLPLFGAEDALHDDLISAVVEDGAGLAEDFLAEHQRAADLVMPDRPPGRGEQIAGEQETVGPECCAMD
jgi:hypothetical protein